MSAAPEMAGEAASAKATGKGFFQVRIDTGAHSFLVDEPAALGGLDTGPNPFDLLASALAGCTLMTLRLYAQRKGWPIDQLRTRAVHRKGAAGERDHFEIELMLGDVTDEQRSGLLRIAQRCPVHILLDRGADVLVSEPAPAFA